MTTTTTCTITTSTITTSTITTSNVLAELPSAGEAAAQGARKAVG
jgi:hypothetical protein